MIGMIGDLKNAALYPFMKTSEAVLNYLHNDNSQNPFLLGNFSPIDKESLFEDLQEIEGKVPSDINGVYLRNGPNPKQRIQGKYHWFDGDGMIHSVRIKNGKVSYSNRYIETEKYKVEEKYKQQIFMKLGDMVGKLGLVKLLQEKTKKVLGYIPNLDELKNGLANTALLNYNQAVYALVENNLPFELLVDPKTGEIKSIDYFDFNGVLKHPFTAHPKVDAETGELMFFGYNVVKQPYVVYSVADKQGRIINQMNINLRKPIMMHDFCITKNYSVICDMPLVFDPARITENKFIFFLDHSMNSRYGVFKRMCNNEQEIQWFDLPTHYVFHYLNSFEDVENGHPVIKIYACYQETFQFDFGLKEKYTNRDLQEKAQLVEIVLDLETGKSQINRLFEPDNIIFGDFPVLNQNLVGLKHKYGYVGTFSNQKKEELATPNFNGFYKYDLEKKQVLARVVYEDGIEAGEVFFQPRDQPKDEDDGYLMTIGYNKDLDKSYFMMWDSKDIRTKPIVKVTIPQRVPFGFHSNFTDEVQIQDQKRL